MFEKALKVIDNEDVYADLTAKGYSEDFMKGYGYAVSLLQGADDRGFPLTDADLGSLNDTLLENLTAAQFIMLYELMSTDLQLAHNTRNCYNCGKFSHCEHKPLGYDCVAYINCVSWEEEEKRNDE